MRVSPTPNSNSQQRRRRDSTLNPIRAYAASTRVALSSPAAFSTVNLRLRKPTTEQVLAAKAVYDALGDDAEKSVPRTKGYIETVFAWQAFGALRDRRMFIDLPVQVLTVGGVLFLAGMLFQFLTTKKKK